MTNADEPKRLTTREQALEFYQPGKLYCFNEYTWALLFSDNSGEKVRSKTVNNLLREARFHSVYANADWSVKFLIRENAGKPGSIHGHVVSPGEPFLLCGVDVMPIVHMDWEYAKLEEDQNAQLEVKQMGKVILNILHKERYGWVAAEVFFYPNEDDARLGYQSFDPYTEIVTPQSEEAKTDINP
jgi:hypothetical protein